MNKLNKKAFSLIEILVWILIFSLWITSIYAIISSTLRINNYNKDYIIATNLAREQIELVRNIRDSNYKRIQKFDQINPSNNDYFNVFAFDKKYKIENNYSTTASFPIEVIDITSWFEEWETKLNWTSMQSYKICIDEKNRYSYDCSNPDNIITQFYKYISVEKVKYNKDWLEEVIDDSFLLKSKVIWYKNGYHEFEIKSIIADWKRL